MRTLYVLYCATVVIAMSSANYAGYTLPALFAGKQAANRMVSSYHK